MSIGPLHSFIIAGKHPVFQDLRIFALCRVPRTFVGLRVCHTGTRGEGEHFVVARGLGGDICRSRGPVQHPEFVCWAPAETQPGAALPLLGIVHIIEALTFYRHGSNDFFFRRCGITSLGRELQTLE